MPGDGHALCLNRASDPFTALGLQCGTMKSVILSIGDELVLGQTVDSNSAYLGARLAEHGIPTLYHQTLSDEMDMIVKAVREAAKIARIILITGGLGPTSDDLTRQALAEAMGVPLVINEDSLRQIEAFFAGRQRSMPERNRVQAMCPEGASPLANSCGTAPGIRAQLGEATIYVMPGVPREMKSMYAEHVEPDILQYAGGRQAILTAKINTFGLGESGVGELLDDLMDRGRNPKVGTTVSDGIVAARIRSEFSNPSVASRELNDTIAQVADRLGAIVFGRDDDTIQESLVELLQKRGLTVTTAESCTGGLVSKMITDVPGASAVFPGGWVVYDNDLKIDELGVAANVIEDDGSVSGPVVESMAKLALDRSGADIALSISGVAGPTGGTEEKPVGTVWIGVAHRLPPPPPEAVEALEALAISEEPTADAQGDGDAPDEPVAVAAMDDCDDEDYPLQVQSLQFHFPGTRDTVRDRTAKCALQVLRLILMNQPLSLIRWSMPK